MHRMTLPPCPHGDCPAAAHYARPMGKFAPHSSHEIPMSGMGPAGTYHIR